MAWLGVVLRLQTTENKVVGEALIQQLLDHFLALEGAGDEKRGVRFAGGDIFLLDGQR